MTWKTYRHRFMPWILLNWKRRFRQSLDVNTCSIKSQADIELLQADLYKYLNTLDCRLKKTASVGPGLFSYSHMRQSFNRTTDHYNDTALKCSQDTLGFIVQRGTSTIEAAGTGVYVSQGAIARDRLVALYPGLIYEAGEPIFFQSIANQFIFRCSDGVLIDGNDRGISKVLFRSCAGREITGSHLVCDVSWLTPHPINIFSVGQYINNHNQENPANVEYQELDLPIDFPGELLKYVPNINYSTDHLYGHQRPRRIVVLRSLRDIKEGEELFSTYMTITR